MALCYGMDEDRGGIMAGLPESFIDEHYRELWLAEKPYSRRPISAAEFERRMAAEKERGRRYRESLTDEQRAENEAIMGLEN